jgi:hypothetical protein
LRHFDSLSEKLTDALNHSLCADGEPRILCARNRTQCGAIERAFRWLGSDEA